jgi:hypothetical protein
MQGIGQDRMDSSSPGGRQEGRSMLVSRTRKGKIGENLLIELDALLDERRPVLYTCALLVIVVD